MKLRLILTVLFLLSLLLLRIDRSVAESNAEEIPQAKIWEKENVLAMSYLKTHDEGILCIATSYVDKSGPVSFTHGKLTFYRQAGNSFKRLHEFDPGFRFLGLFRLYNGDLMSLWTGVSALYVSVFSLTEKEIKLVVEEGGVKTTPEMADIDNDGLPEILISTGVKIRPESSRIEPETTSIYKWNGKSYDLIRTSPWERRFDSLRLKESGQK